MINDDHFDVWLATRYIVLRDQVRALAETGLQGWFVGGNHDVIQLRGAFSHDEIGMRILEEAVPLHLPDFDTLAVHRSGSPAGEVLMREAAQGP